MTFSLPDLPYPVDALAPNISADTLRLHHGKHHATYVDKLNGLVSGTRMESLGLDAIVLESADNPEQVSIFNNAGQAWNHNHYWNCMRPNGGGAPTGDIADAINGSFGSFDDFRSKFLETAAAHFGSGWAWLVLDGDALKATSTPNAMPPIVHGQKALIACDVWEHSYYLDYQNRRPDYLAAFVDKLLNWDYVNQQLASARRG